MLPCLLPLSQTPVSVIWLSSYEYRSAVRLRMPLPIRGGAPLWPNCPRPGTFLPSVTTTILSTFPRRPGGYLQV